MNTYGYARVSSSDQNLGRQIQELTKFGIPENKIFCDKKSGKDFERKEYTRVLADLKKFSPPTLSKSPKITTESVSL